MRLHGPCGRGVWVRVGGRAGGWAGEWSGGQAGGCACARMHALWTAAVRPGCICALQCFTLCHAPCCTAHAAARPRTRSQMLPPLLPQSLPRCRPCTRARPQMLPPLLSHRTVFAALPPGEEGILPLATPINTTFRCTLEAIGSFNDQPYASGAGGRGGMGVGWGWVGGSWTGGCCRVPPQPPAAASPFHPKSILIRVEHKYVMLILTLLLLLPRSHVLRRVLPAARGRERVVHWHLQLLQEGACACMQNAVTSPAVPTSYKSTPNASPFLPLL